MKWVFVFVNLAAAGGVICAGLALLSVHHVHSYSTYVALRERGALATPPKPASPEDPVGPDGHYDVAKVLERIGGLDVYIPTITYSSAALFVLNAVAFLSVWKKQPRVSSSSP